MKSFTETDAVFIDAGASKLLDRTTLEHHFDRLVAANGLALTRLAATYTNTPTDRDDLLQEIAMALWQALPRFRGECSERTFLFRIAHNPAITYLCRSRAHPEPGTEVEVHDPAPAPEAGLARRT